MNPRYLVIGFFGIGVAVLIGKAFVQEEQNPHSVQKTKGIKGAPLADVIVPELSVSAEEGRIAYEANCATCHGVNAAGQDGIAPPLVHKIYEPNHHGDSAFLVAARNGVRAHHWRFGNMPPVANITDQEVVSVVNYVRELQRANGIR